EANRASLREGAIPPSWVTGDAIAEAPDRLDHAGRQLSPQSRHEDLDRVRVALEVLRIELFRELGARYDFALAVQQAGEQAKLVARERQGTAVHRHAGAAGVEHDVATGDLDARPAGAAPNQGAQARKELLHVEGLREVVVGAGVDALHLLVPGIARRQDEHGHGAAVAAPAA